MIGPLLPVRDDIGVVVLAAGEGRRLGLGPKAHVRLGDETFLARIVRTCRLAELQHIWVVGSALDTKLKAVCQALGVEPVLHPRPELGMFSSVRVGLRAALPDCAGGVMIFSVDLPLVRASTLVNLAGALQDDACVRPLHATRHGHPIAVGAALGAKLLTSDPSMTLRDALAAAHARTVDVPCDDRATLDNVNTLADLTRLQDALQQGSATVER